MGIYKGLKYLAYIVGGIGVILFLILIGKGDSEIVQNESVQDGLLNPFLYLTYFIFILTIIAILIFVIGKFFGGGNMKNLLIGLGVFVVIWLVSFVIANGDPITYANGSSISGSGAKWMNTGLNMTYILVALAVVALLLSSVQKLTFKK